jgi:hypothetical protein
MKLASKSSAASRPPAPITASGSGRAWVVRRPPRVSRNRRRRTHADQRGSSSIEVAPSASALALILYARRAGRISLADGIALVADCLTVATLPGEQQAMAGLFSEIFSSTLNGLVSAAARLSRRDRNGSTLPIGRGVGGNHSPIAEGADPRANVSCTAPRPKS